MSKRAGAIAMAVLVSGLLFSSAASARQTADSITVTGAVLGPAPNGTYVQFFSGNSAPYGNGTPFKQITFSGGSNFHFAGIEGAGGNCQLTQANGGITCTAAPEFPTLPNIWLNTLISGTLPTAVAGTVVYADDSTGTFTAPVGDVAPASYIPPRTDAIVNGTSIQISVGGALPPFLQFSLSGGSNWHVTSDQRHRQRQLQPDPEQWRRVLHLRHADIRLCPQRDVQRSTPELRARAARLRPQRHPAVVLRRLLSLHDAQGRDQKCREARPRPKARIHSQVEARLHSRQLAQPCQRVSRHSRRGSTPATAWASAAPGQRPGMGRRKAHHPLPPARRLCAHDHRREAVRANRSRRRPGRSDGRLPPATSLP